MVKNKQTAMWNQPPVHSCLCVVNKSLFGSLKNIDAYVGLLYKFGLQLIISGELSYILAQLITRCSGDISIFFLTPSIVILYSS